MVEPDIIYRVHYVVKLENKFRYEEAATIDVNNWNAIPNAVAQLNISGNLIEHTQLHIEEHEYCPTLRCYVPADRR